MKKKAKQYSDYVEKHITDPVEKREALRKSKSSVNVTWNKPLTRSKYR